MKRVTCNSYLERHEGECHGATGSLVVSKLLHFSDPLFDLSTDLLLLQPHVRLDHLNNSNTNTLVTRALNPVKFMPGNGHLSLMTHLFEAGGQGLQRNAPV